MADNDDRYTAHLAIKKVTVKQTTPAHRGIAPERERDISEVTTLNLKASTLPKLIEKLGKHVAIIEED